jgi:hypothetical protein
MVGINWSTAEQMDAAEVYYDDVVVDTGRPCAE